MQVQKNFPCNSDLSLSNVKEQMVGSAQQHGVGLECRQLEINKGWLVVSSLRDGRVDKQ